VNVVHVKLIITLMTDDVFPKASRPKASF
jgi:hypothetical protein